MDPMARGLRFRLGRAARHTAEQHRHIQEILRDFDRAVREGDRSALADVFRLYRSALTAHFSLEEEVFFPALHGLHPEHAGELDALSREHQEVNAVLEELDARVEAEEVDSFLRAFQELVDRLTGHEQREEALVHSLSDVGPGTGSESSDWGNRSRPEG